MGSYFVRLQLIRFVHRQQFIQLLNRWMLHFFQIFRNPQKSVHLRMLVRSRRYELVESLAKDVAIGT